MCNVIGTCELPDVMENTLPSIGEVLQSFNLPRSVIASNDDIGYAWKELPREISKIPIELRNELVARMCVAISVGLFDGAINYIWNATILALRNKVKNFGLGYVAQLKNKKFEEENLNGMKDVELLDLCHELEILSEDGYFFLSQCREIRNNFSLAHPSIAQIDDRELIVFINRCCRYGIASDYQVHGIRISDFIEAIKSGKLSEEAIDMWSNNIAHTFSAQRNLLLPMLYSMYCDDASTEYARMNALKISLRTKLLFDSKIKSALLSQYNEYRIKDDSKRINASRIYFQKLGILELLSNAEVHSMISNACKWLYSAHQGFDNFYNEPPFAQSLCEIVVKIAVPDSAKEEFVRTVVTCYVGNPYGVSHAAISYYERMIEKFTPQEINFMLDLVENQGILTNRIKNYRVCRSRFLDALKMINSDSLTNAQTIKYNDLINKLG